MSKLKDLTPALLGVLEEAAAGWTADESGKHLGKSGDTVKVQRRLIMELWGARNMTQAVAMGIREGVIK